MVKCRRLKSPVREYGSIRRCKLPRKTRAGRKSDYAKKSGEFHELRYRSERKSRRRR